MVAVMNILIDTDTLDICAECAGTIRAKDRKVVIGKGQNNFFVLHPGCEPKAAEWIYGLNESE